MSTTEKLMLAIALIELANPIVSVFCHWLKLKLNKRYGVN